MVCAAINFIVYFCVYRRNLNYFSSAYTAAVSAVDPDAGHGELVIKIPSEIWKLGDGNVLLLLIILFGKAVTCVKIYVELVWLETLDPIV